MVSGPAVLLLSSRRTCAGGQAERTAPGGAGGGGTHKWMASVMPHTATAALVSRKSVFGVKSPFQDLLLLHGLHTHPQAKLTRTEAAIKGLHGRRASLSSRGPDQKPRVMQSCSSQAGPAPRPGPCPAGVPTP